MSITIEMRRVPVANGKAYVSMDEFRKDAIGAFFDATEDGREGGHPIPYKRNDIVEIIVENADTIIEILTLNTRSRPQMRKDRKARKPRKQDATLPLPDNT